VSPHRHRQPRGGRGATTREREPEVAHNGLRVAVLERRGRFLLGEPFFERGRGVPVERDHRAKVGDLVLLRANGRGRGAAKVVRVIGRPDNTRAVIEALMLDRGLARRFDPAVEREAKQVRDVGGAPHARGVPRRDLRELPTFTIDPATAKDFDDAISAARLPGDGARIWVHIADVSAFVAPGSAVDREAHKRGTSVYVPGAVEPMLPEALSNDACSLRPDEDRLAVTVEMDFLGEKVTRAAFYRSLIRSDRRLDYGRVDRIFAGAERAEGPWAEPLGVAREVAAALAAERERQGALTVESVEPEFVFDLTGQVTRAVLAQQTESHRVIEHLMIAANEQVATLLEQQSVPTLYRVHERPDPARVEHLAAQLASLGVATPPLRENMSPQQAADAVAEMSRLVDEHVRRTGHGRAGLTSLVLRSLKQAYYSPRNLGHAGLRLARYCHFTSPIRRYPDLVCHRALLSAVGGREEAPKAGGLEALGEWTSARERAAMKIERDADDVARCFLLERALFEAGWRAEFDGEVVSVIGAGAFVVFGDGYEGMIPVRRLGGDWWELNEEGTILRGERTGETLRIGDPIRVRVDRVDAPRGRVDLLPASVDEED
jgi:ribonuclease R